jgi:hypothetical protein
MKRKEAVKKLREAIGEGFGKPIATSSQKGEGLDVVWRTCWEFATGASEEDEAADPGGANGEDA